MQYQDFRKLPNWILQLNCINFYSKFEFLIHEWERQTTVTSLKLPLACHTIAAYRFANLANGSIYMWACGKFADIANHHHSILTDSSNWQHTCPVTKYIDEKNLRLKYIDEFNLMVANFQSVANCLLILNAEIIWRRRLASRKKSIMHAHGYLFLFLLLTYTKNFGNEHTCLVTNKFSFPACEN